MKPLQLPAKLLIALSIAGSVHAQGFHWSTASARSIALGGIYAPTQDGVSDALAANPAGLNFLSGRTLDLNLTGIFARGSFSNSVNTNAPLTNAPGFIPSGAFGAPFGHSRFSFGVGFVPELMSASNWNYRDAPAVGGANYGVSPQKSAIVAARAVFGISFAFNRKLAFGLSAGPVYNSNTLKTLYVFQSNPALAGLKTSLDLHTTGVGWGAGVGFIATPTSHWQFSGAWKSSTKIDSTGDADGNIGVQLSALGLGNARPDFHYAATVRNILPQSALAGANWRLNSRWTFAAQADWIGWKSAFSGLPVLLTAGSNADINALLGSNAIFDRIPLDWKNQFAFRGGMERRVAENVSLRGGYAHANSPVPSSTLSPLTAAIMTNQLSTGIGYRHAPWRFDLGYGIAPSRQESVGKTALLSGEYANSRVRIGTQSVALTTSVQF